MTTGTTHSRLSARLTGALQRFAHLARRGQEAVPGEKAEFRCNICGSNCVVPMRALQREVPSCRRCGSTVRTRTIAHLLTTELFGRSIALPELPLRRDIVGVGLSDSQNYAGRLAEKLGYTNTFFHMEPRLDIAQAPESFAGRFDFIVASDVFEHVAPPVSRAFVNARRLLKPHGVFIFSVPYTLDPETREHYPELHDYRILEAGSEWRLENTTVDGRTQVFTNLVFHGGPGSTLEMRLFSRSSLIREFADAGFAGVRIAEEPHAACGIVWPEPWSIPMVAYCTLDR
ncbi:MAG TPA: class I SAM-dependent methyltransferase [Casimicrobiaceae bacterium]|nr:class I SAM-dependent methyltransferase [Casimicrobiaceae bacterium]